MDITEIGERWDAEELDRTAAVVEAMLPGKTIARAWLDIPDSQRRKLIKAIWNTQNILKR